MDSPTFTQNTNPSLTVAQTVEQMPAPPTDKAGMEPNSLPHSTTCTCEWCGGCRRPIHHWGSLRTKEGMAKLRAIHNSDESKVLNYECGRLWYQKDAPVQITCAVWKYTSIICFV
ncbi:uncharacterized protein NECHADRAFT_82806 [Fusarium vanettenii 77-13-4]|uniref:Uncharacterized protein n=1 Tax=Fusarium vanettenii (strain ATCC MYA-4622 / CBS 123669 / FGSC 9596 / NRRL 45880 / 77-13-4) TaxID=660122 RepID=C7YWW4_FUSV7|nr:uncharacterized protein NECHADRAFT_82806 [Fusarium vanettenii 77-13-4]EEU43725.1 predicted protein [Fusarium vanettenii 77-13-4]